MRLPSSPIPEPPIENPAEPVWSAGFMPENETGVYYLKLFSVTGSM